MTRTVLIALALWMVASGSRASAADSWRELRVHPSEITLTTPEGSEQILVHGIAPDGRQVDLTRDADYSAVSPDILSISRSGRVFPRRNGRTEVVIQAGEQSARLTVTVRGLDSPPPVSLQRDVIPILSKAGCNSGGCHGKAEGQGGFKLSVFGYDPASDLQAMVFQGRGRRVFPAAPEQSLLLLKATATVPHGGGQKIDPDSPWYRRFRRWIAEGARQDGEAAIPIVALAVEPAEVTLPALGTQQLRVVARDQAGQEICVTAEAEFQSNNDAVAVVDRDGWITATAVPGEAAILVRYLGQVAVCRVTRPRESVEFQRPQETNFVDRLVWDKLARLRIAPSPRADDATFLRRVFLDTIGTLPTAEEARRFLADGSADKRPRIIDHLLERPEYADYWAQRWADLLQVDKDTITPQGTVAMTRWIRGQLADNVPYDEFVRSILTARGPTLRDSPAAFFQVQDDPEKAARAVSQLFLGVRIECAQCHHHPFERWDQQDYFALAGFFTGIDRKKAAYGGQKIVLKPGTDLKHPRTDQLVPAAGLGSAPSEFAEGDDRRRSLADWMTSPDNPYFARTIANRLWSHYFGRGLVEPVDDLRATNPASNEPLLEALAEHVRQTGYDLKAVTRTLLQSQAYQRSAEENESNRLDEQNYSHAAWRPLPAEVLLDAISQVTGVPEPFNGWPEGYRAIQVWDNKLPSRFLEVFGRPARQTVCACERGTEPSVAQALHLMNSPDLIAKIHDPRGRAAELAASGLDDQGLVEELYLSAFARYPTGAERELMLRALATAPDRRQAIEDILWTLLNTKEFVFNH